jgi:hypothetical protein
VAVLGPDEPGRALQVVQPARGARLVNGRRQSLANAQRAAEAWAARYEADQRRLERERQAAPRPAIY